MKGGVDITDKFNDRTTSIKVDLISGGGDGDHCMIKVDDRDWAVVRPEPGENLSIWLGYQEVGLAYMGSFEIDEVTFLGMPRGIQLTGLSTGMRDIQKSPQIKDFANKSVNDILGGMASQTGLGVSIGAGIGGNTIPFKNQVVSNLHMIHELERIYGAVAKVVDGKLMFVARDSTESASGVALPTLVLLPEHFGTWQVRYSSRSDYSGTKAAWFDKDEMVRKWVSAGSSAASGGSTSGQYALGQLFNSQAEAEAAAKSKMEALKRAEVQAAFDLAKGDPWVRDMQTILVSGMRDGINGSYVIEKATHTYIKSTGIRSTLECRAPGDGADFSDRASDEFMRPGPGELMGEVLRENPQFLQGLTGDGRDVTP
jgi:phage protein D